MSLAEAGTSVKLSPQEPANQLLYSPDLGIDLPARGYFHRASSGKGLWDPLSSLHIGAGCFVLRN